MDYLKTIFYRYTAKKVLTVAPVLFALLISSSFAGGSRDDCFICGMWIDQYMYTRHVVTKKEDLNDVKFCSLTCAAKFLKKNKATIQSIKVGLYLTGELIDAEKAYYLVGSDVPGVMSYLSKIAFSSKEDVVKFQKEYGGQITVFSDALAIK